VITNFWSTLLFTSVYCYAVNFYQAGLEVDTYALLVFKSELRISCEILGTSCGVPVLPGSGAYS